MSASDYTEHIARISYDKDSGSVGERKMANEIKITSEQLYELDFELMFGDDVNFQDRLEEYTGLTARPVIMMQIFDGDDYVGNTHNDLLTEILRKAGIEVVEDGK